MGAGMVVPKGQRKRKRETGEKEGWLYEPIQV